VRTGNRLLERGATAAFVLAALAATVLGASSCSSDDQILGEDLSDAAATDDAAPVADAGPGTDADAAPSAPVRDAATSDAAPSPVVCTTPPCATALVTTVASTPIAGGFCALLQDKTVACWGENREAQLGRGAAAGTTDSAVPQRVEGLTGIEYLGRGCAVDGAGDSWCWGTGPFLRSTDAASTTEASPVKLPIPAATMVSVTRHQDISFPEQSYAVGCAVVDSGVICWGTNNMGHSALPEVGAAMTKTYEPRTLPVPSGAPIKELSVGWAAFAVRADGTALSWGANPPLGRVSSLFPDPYPRPASLPAVTIVDAFHENACAVSQGIAYCWGGNVHGTFNYGVDEPMKFAVPAVVPTPEPVVDIATHSSVGNTTIPQRACAVGVSGAVYCWGNNASGQVGDGTREYALAPVKVAGLPAPASRVKVNARSTCALLTNGKIHCWGDNAYGQLGNGRLRQPSLVPQEVVLP